MIIAVALAVVAAAPTEVAKQNVAILLTEQQINDDGSFSFRWIVFINQMQITD